MPDESEEAHGFTLCGERKAYGPACDVFDVYRWENDRAGVHRQTYTDGKRDDVDIFYVAKLITII